MSTQEAQAGAVEVEQSKGRRITFRVVAILVALLLIAQQIFGLLEIVIMWLPGDTISSIFNEDFSEIAAHRTHFMSIGIIAWGLVMTLVAQWRKPERRVTQMQLAIGMVLAGMVLFGLSGTLGDWLVEEILSVFVPVALVVVLHPTRSQLFTRPEFDRPVLGMAVLAAAPWLIYIVDNAWAQFTNAAGDSHAEMEHWAISALMAVTLSVAAFLGASEGRGWRFTGWFAAVGTAIIGVHSLVFPGLASALPAVWAVAAVLWAVVFAVMIVRRSEPVETAASTA